MTNPLDDSQDPMPPDTVKISAPIVIGVDPLPSAPHRIERLAQRLETARPFATSEVMGTTSTRKRKGRFLFRDLAPCFPIFEDPVRCPDHN
jgi:hypothetical protein